MQPFSPAPPPVPPHPTTNPPLPPLLPCPPQLCLRRRRLQPRSSWLSCGPSHSSRCGEQLYPHPLTHASPRVCQHAPRFPPHPPSATPLPTPATRHPSSSHTHPSTRCHPPTRRHPPTHLQVVARHASWPSGPSGTSTTRGACCGPPSATGSGADGGGLLAERAAVLLLLAGLERWAGPPAWATQAQAQPQPQPASQAQAQPPPSHHEEQTAQQAAQQVAQQVQQAVQPAQSRAPPAQQAPALGGTPPRRQRQAWRSLVDPQQWGCVWLGEEVGFLREQHEAVRRLAAAACP